MILIKNNETGVAAPETQEQVINKDWFLENKYFFDFEFREKPIPIDRNTVLFYFDDYKNSDIWLLIEKQKVEKRTAYLYQWISIKDEKTQRLCRKVQNKELINVKVKSRDEELIKGLTKSYTIEKNRIEGFLDELGIFLDENEDLIFNSDFEDLNDRIEEDCKEDELFDEDMKEFEEILKRKDLFYYIDRALYERNDRFIIGEFNSKFTLFLNCVGAGLGIDTINTLKADSSIGKTTVADVVSGLFKTKRVGQLTDAALKYMDFEDVDILYFQETTEEEFEKKEVRLLSGDDGGFKAEITVKDPETNEFKVIEKEIPVKTIITTTTSLKLDPEFATRNFTLPMDDSEEQTERIVNENFNSSTKKLRELLGEKQYEDKYQKLKKALRLLKRYEVLIPYENELIDLFPKYEPRARRDSKKLLKLIKECALLFQYQREIIEINGINVLIADTLDLFYALKFGGLILEATLTGFDSRLMKSLPIVYKIIKEQKYVTSKNLAIKLNISPKYAWQILKSFEDAGLILHDEDTKEEMEIKGRERVYIKNGDNESKNLFSDIRNIDWVKLENKRFEWIGKQIPNLPKRERKNIAHIPYFDKTGSISVKKIFLVQEERFGINQHKELESDSSNIERPINLIDENRKQDLKELLKATYHTLKPEEKMGLYPIPFQDGIGTFLNIEDENLLADYELELIKSDYILQDKPGDRIFPSPKLLKLFDNKEATQI